ncbi:hypothetical protein [Streptomyces globisporus]|uniref:hypothetical protein n=1 Tax=Streptomyces globisporus TaxID=1908 RepID=UPI0004C82E34|nr:hypothetical protein [Streptomyces globisporus]
MTGGDRSPTLCGIRTSEPVIEACPEARVPYLDFDDVENIELGWVVGDERPDVGRCPSEDWADPQVEGVGTPRKEIVESV